MSSRALLGEVSRVYAATCAVTLLVSHTPGPIMGLFGHIALAATFLALALARARSDARGPRHYGLDLAGLLEAHPEEPDGFVRGLWFAVRRALPRLGSELAVALALSLLLFPPFVLAFTAWHDVRHSFTFHPPREPVDFVLTQLVVIALPEEALFRGYLQTRLSDLFPARRRLFGAEVSLPALSLQAALFALLHFLVGFAPGRLAVFFPGLVFGWLRARRGGIGAAVWFHVLCNLLAELLTRGYL